jgi:protoporphyrinogen oxidase
MKREATDTVVLGAGPSGLAAAYTLAKAGRRPIVLERDKVSGGLMRSLKRGDFILDIGRKELYNRLAKVDEFWSGLLAGDFREYPHRGGILFDGHIIDMSPAYRGPLRGMPPGMFVNALADFLWWRMKPGRHQAANLEQFWYYQRGRRLTRIANQGFQEKLVGRKWSEVILPAGWQDGNGHAAHESFLGTVSQAARRIFTKKEPNTFKGIWRHPARGTGQICDAMERGIREAGGSVLHQVQVTAIGAANGAIQSVTAEIGGETIVYEPKQLVASTPAEFLHQHLLGTSPGAAARPSSTRRRVVVLVYLFLDEPPRFPHFWLQVTDPSIKVGRIANYAALNSDMVPPGKTCLCLEYYCFGPDPFLDKSDEEIAQTGLDECARSGLVTASKCFDRLVLRFPGADASQNRHNWFSEERQRIIGELRRFENLYFVNRTDLDISTLAGLEAAEAILSGDRSAFDRHFDPRELGIRSEHKPFEFRNPPGVVL